MLIHGHYWRGIESSERINLLGFARNFKHAFLYVIHSHICARTSRYSRPSTRDETGSFLNSPYSRRESTNTGIFGLYPAIASIFDYPMYFSSSRFDSSNTRWCELVQGAVIVASAYSSGVIGRNLLLRLPEQEATYRRPLGRIVAKP